jgi:hypothetical protein
VNSPAATILSISAKRCVNQSSAGGAPPKPAQLPPGQCSANDISHEEEEEERVAGCTEVIESGKTRGWTLKTAYCNRGYALTELREYDRVNSRA